MCFKPTSGWQVHGVTSDWQKVQSAFHLDAAGRCTFLAGQRRKLRFEPGYVGQRNPMHTLPQVSLDIHCRNTNISLRRLRRCCVRDLHVHAGCLMLVLQCPTAPQRLLAEPTDPVPDKNPNSTIDKRRPPRHRCRTRSRECRNNIESAPMMTKGAIPATRGMLRA